MVCWKIIPRYSEDRIGQEQMSHLMRKPAYAYANNKGAEVCASAESDQRLCFRCLESIIPLLAISKISRLQLVSEAEEASLSLTWSQTLKTGFLVMRFFYSLWIINSAIKLQNKELSFSVFGQLDRWAIGKSSKHGLKEWLVSVYMHLRYGLMEKNTVNHFIFVWSLFCNF